jgi:hypothetical protein
MQEFVELKILHVKYSSREIPPDLDDLGSIYEGYIENRVGVNLPMRVLKAVYPGHRLTKHEADYIIVYPDWDRNHTRNHELRHAHYFLDKEYRKRVTKEWENLSSLNREKICKKLQQLGYSPEVHCDEWQAYEGEIP